MKFSSALLASGAVAGVSASDASHRVTYNAHQVIRCEANTKSQMDQLQMMSEDSALDLDFWMEPRKSAGSVDIMTTSTGHRTMIEKKLKALDIPCRVMIEDVQTLIDLERTRYDESSKKVGESDFLSLYSTLFAHYFDLHL